MTYSLRPYQQDVVDYALPRLRENKKPLLVSLGTGSGKTWVIAETAKQWGGRVLVLTLSRELCAQDYEKLCFVAGADKVGLYSAGLGSRDHSKLITVATVQSAYRHPELWDSVSLLILDECDNISPDGMASVLVKDKRVLGLTATAYATQGSFNGRWYVTKLFPLHKIKTKDWGWFWQPVEFCVSEKQLTDEGYLAPLKMYCSPIRCSLLRINSNGSEYDMSSVDEWVAGIYDRIIEVVQGAETHGMCTSGIIFMPSVESCYELERLCDEFGIDARAVSFKTKAKERDEIINQHKAGEIKWLINQGCLTRGFDAPQVDCLVICRPTRSLRLWRQILGRGVRLCEGKTHCNVLDLTENSKTWGDMRSVVMGKNGWCDTILLNGIDISGKEVGRIKIGGNRYIPPKPQEDWDENEPLSRSKKWTRTKK